MDRQEAEIIAQVFGGKPIRGKDDADWSVRIDQSDGHYVVLEREGASQYAPDGFGGHQIVAVIPFW